MYLCVDSKDREFKFTYEPRKVYDKNDNCTGTWKSRTYHDHWYQLKTGTIEKWIGEKLTWDDQPVKTSQAAVDAKKAEQAPQGLIQVLREQTEDLKILFLEKTKIYAENQFESAKKIAERTTEEWCKHFGIEPHTRNDFVVFPIGFYNSKQAKEYSRIKNKYSTIYSTGKDKFIEKALKKANQHYESSLIKLVDRLTRKGLTDTNFKIIEKSLDVNFELILEHEANSQKIETKCWTIIAEGAIRAPHYRYLVK